MNTYQSKLSNERGFQFIELGIGLVLLVLLGFVAVPNYNDAEARSKIVRVNEDIQRQTAALLSYEADFAALPPAAEAFAPGDPSDTVNYHARTPSYLTTPIAYLSSIPFDPFVTKPPTLTGQGEAVGRRYIYYNTDQLVNDIVGNDIWDGLEAWIGPWLFYSFGPDNSPFQGPRGTLMPYDPTNGTLSAGNIIRTAKNATGIDPHPVTGTFIWP